MLAIWQSPLRSPRIEAAATQPLTSKTNGRVKKIRRSGEPPALARWRRVEAPIGRGGEDPRAFDVVSHAHDFPAVHVETRRRMRRPGAVDPVELHGDWLAVEGPDRESPRRRHAREIAEEVRIGEPAGEEVGD